MLTSGEQERNQHGISTLDYMSLSLGELDLLALQSSIVSLESMRDIDSGSPRPGSIGWLYCGNQQVPVYSLAENLEIEQDISSSKNICAILKHQDTYLSLMCCEVTPFRQKIVKLHSLPDCMQSTPTPIDSLCLCKTDNISDIKFITSAKKLGRYINESGGLKHPD